VYLLVLLLQITVNGGSFYSYKLRKLEEVEKKVKDYEGSGEGFVVVVSPQRLSLPFCYSPR